MRERARLRATQLPVKSRQHPGQARGTVAVLLLAFWAFDSSVGASHRLQVICFGGELLGHAENLIKDGLHPSEIVEGYQKAAVKV